MTGGETKLDKNMIEMLADPMIHIMRNSLDHGIEKPDVREQKGKDSSGTVTLKAYAESDRIMIEIIDDGAGINVEKVASKVLEKGLMTSEQIDSLNENEMAELVLLPGLSTADEITEYSGRGVGMDVVMNNISSLGGSVTITTTKDKGSKITIHLPLTLAILDGLNVLVSEKQLIMPLNMIVESLQPTSKMIKKIGDNQKEILMLRDEFIPIVRLHKFFNIPSNYTNVEDGMLIVTKVANTKAASLWMIFLNQEQIVVKSLEKNYKKIDGIGAATIRGDGSIGLILDIMNIIENEKALSWS
jgi:two-component system chemotaxis sensor kinase CheA